MALTDENGGGIPATMLVGPANLGGASMPYPYPVYQQGGGNGGNGGFGDGNGWWIILLFILIAAMGGNWGGNNNSGGAFGGGQPIIVNDGGGSSVQRGFDQAAVMSGLTSLQSGISGLSTQLCGCCCDMQNTVNQGFFGVQNALCNGFNGVEQNANTRQIANMQQAFASQMAMSQGFNGVQSGVADLKYTVATENCADRTAAAQNTRDIIDSQTRGTQAILDKLCALELDGYKRENDQLRTQLSAANLAASQTAQTAQIRDGQVAAVSALVNELRSCPIPSQPVYGSQPIFTCPNNNNNGCGCGCGNNF